jgi:hypothetical protein
VLALIVWAAYAVLNRMGYVHEWSNGRLGKARPAAESTNARPVAVTAPTNAPAK